MQATKLQAINRIEQIRGYKLFRHELDQIKKYELPGIDPYQEILALPSDVISKWFKEYRIDFMLFNSVHVGSYEFNKFQYLTAINKQWADLRASRPTASIELYNKAIQQSKPIDLDNATRDARLGITDATPEEIDQANFDAEIKSYNATFRSIWNLHSVSGDQPTEFFAPVKFVIPFMHSILKDTQEVVSKIMSKRKLKPISPIERSFTLTEAVAYLLNIRLKLDDMRSNPLFEGIIPEFKHITLQKMEKLENAKDVFEMSIKIPRISFGDRTEEYKVEQYSELIDQTLILISEKKVKPEIMNQLRKSIINDIGSIPDKIALGFDKLGTGVEDTLGVIEDQTIGDFIDQFSKGLDTASLPIIAIAALGIVILTRT